LQAYRGFAALFVVLSHAQEYCKSNFQEERFSFFFRFGDAGVQFFFVLSGFIILWVHAGDMDKPARLANYLSKRLVRIYPIYWLVTLALLPFWIFIPEFGNPYHKEFLSLIQSLLLWPQNHFPHLAVGWTLSHEILFYLVFGILVLSRRIGLAVLGAWGLGILAAGWNTEGASPWTALIFDFHNLLFLFGMGAALAIRRIPALQGGLGTTSSFLGFLLMTAALALDWKAGFGAASVLIVLGCRSRAFEGFFQSRKFLGLLGDASYSISPTPWWAGCRAVWPMSPSCPGSVLRL
jgi:peptidoglycan/LPS O-acetylase OafA/YrhL